jgi:formamidopyrimidine-DNA glycosylase
VPEGDSVLVAAARVDAALAGGRLRRTEFRVPAFATSDLAGQVLTEAVARGKHLLFRTEGELGRITLHTHFKMDGRWDLHRPGDRWHGPAHEVRAILETEECTAVGRRLWITELIRTEDEGEVLGHLGPDVLGPDWDPQEALTRMLSAPDRAIGEVLIDQRVMAGPGNVYKSEVCFLRGIDPWTPVSQVSEPERVVALLKRLMDANRTTGRQITTGDTRPGRDRWVYGRAGRPCLRCGTPIRSGQQGAEPSERVTYWCPSCQPVSVRSGGRT